MSVRTPHSARSRSGENRSYPGTVTMHLTGLAAILALIGAVFHDSFAAMVSVWMRSETYTHGFIILPISLWLIWRRRDILYTQTPRAGILAVPAMFGCGFLWLLGRYAGVNTIEWFAVVAMLPAAVWLAMGFNYLWRWLFPLAYLLLAVPFGSFLVPPLMEFTADVTVTLVRASGIPVYREGLYFSLPSGNWSVVEACSGQRYLIAAVTLGLLYAYLNYRRLSRRLAFVAASIVVPIIANGLRAYMIVMMGHLSGMRVAVGVDHLLYGWVFFGIVMGLLFWVGSYWREGDDLPPSTVAETAGVAPGHRGRLKADAGVLALGIAAILAWPGYAALSAASAANDARYAVELPTTIAGWRQTGAEPDWHPAYRALSHETSATYERDGNVATVYVGTYDDQAEGSELIMWGNGLVPRTQTSPRHWRLVARGGERLETAEGGAMRLGTARVARGEQTRRVFYAYLVDGELATDALRTKWLTLRARFAGRTDAGAIVAVSVPADAGTAGEPDRFVAAAVGDVAGQLRGRPEGLRDGS